MLPEEVFGVGIIFEQFVSQGVVFALRTGHLSLLVVVCLDDNQLHS